MTEKVLGTAVEVLGTGIALHVYLVDNPADGRAVVLSAEGARELAALLIGSAEEYESQLRGQ